MTRRLLAWLAGWVRVQARGDGVRTLINLAALDGCDVWGVRRQADLWTFHLAAADWPTLRSLAQRQGLRLALMRQAGLPFFFGRLARRPLLAAGALLFVVAVYALSTFVWVVQVEGTSEVAPSSIAAAAARLGLRPGAWRPSLNTDRVAQRLPLLVPQLAWADVRIRGTRAVVLVAEEHEVPPAQRARTGPADLVARADGLVTSVITLAGTPLVHAGDTVSKGQVLIQGRPGAATGAEGSGSAPATAPSEASGGASAGAGGMRARGSVLGRVWYDQYLEIPAQSMVETPTGRSRTRDVLWFGSFGITVWGWGSGPYPHFRMDDHTRALRWQGAQLPIRWEHKRYVEVRRQVVPRSESDARAAAQREALARVALNLPPDARILKQSARVVLRAATRWGIRVSIETEENLAEVREVRASPPAASSG